MKFTDPKTFIEWAARLQKQGLVFLTKRSRARVTVWSSYQGRYVHYSTNARGHGRFEPDNWRSSLALFDTRGQEVSRKDMAELERWEWLRESVKGVVNAGDRCPRCYQYSPLYLAEVANILRCNNGHWFNVGEVAA